MGFSFTRDAELWEVTVPAMSFGPDGRYEIPERVFTVGRVSSRGEAVAVAVRWACSDAGHKVLWRPWLREVADRCTAVRSVEVVKIPA